MSFLIWLVVAAALAAIGLGVSHSLSPTITVVPGSETSRAEHLAKSNFGPSVLVPVMLEGPKAQLDKQGPVLVRALAGRRDTRVLSAWDVGDTGASLRPDATHAMIIASVGQTEKAMVDGIQQDINKIVDQKISSPVTSYITGTPTIDIATKNQSLDTARNAELLALPILFVVLLLILRAPVAALGLTAFGGATTLMSFGAMAVLGKAIDVDPTAVTLASMTGLALGVSYAMLVHRRWREESKGLEHTRTVDALAAARAVETTGRAVLIGGTALVITLAMAPLIAPNTIVISLGIGMTICAALAIGGATVVLPAVMVLMGRRLEAFSFNYPSFVTAPWNALSERGGGWVIRNAIVAGAMATAVLVVLALPLTSLKTGPVSPALLPKSDSARMAYEKISAVMGPGFTTPFNIVVVSKDKPITDRAMLKQFDKFQNQIASDKRVKSVVGPGDLYATAGELNALPKQLNSSKKMLKTAPAGLKQLETGLGTAGAGSQELQSGVAAAASGAQQLASGSGQASSGSAQLHAGLATAQSGAAKISGGLSAALSGAKQLQTGANAALAGSKQISNGLGQAVTPVKAGAPAIKAMAGDISSAKQSVDSATSSNKSTVSSISSAQAQLKSMSTGTSDPAYQAAVSALSQASGSAASTASSLSAASSKLTSAGGVAGAFAAQIDELSAGLQQLYSGSQALSAGIAKLAAGQSSLVSGISQLNTGGGALNSGLKQLTSGAGQLESGLNQLSSGNSQLATGLTAAPGQIDPLISGLDKMRIAVAKFRGELPSASDIERLQAQSPGLFDSGYFVLAAVAGAPQASQNQAAQVVNLRGGGTAGMIMVVPKESATSSSTQALGKDLVTMSDNFAKATKTEAAVGGTGGALGDFTSEGKAKIWPLVIAEAIAILILLIATLRAVVLPAVAVAFDLLTAGATFGILTLLYSGDNAILSGGPGYIDPISIIGIFAFIFGVSMIYEVGLLYRIRESFLKTGDAHGAVREGLSRTSAAATGAAAVMVAAIIPFAAVDLLSVQVFGVGVVIAVLIDALITRPVLLPAAVEVLGRRSWWPLSRQAPPTPPREEAPQAPPRAPRVGGMPVGT